MSLGGKAAELWEEDENENIYLFIGRDFRKLDEDAFSKSRYICFLGMV